LYTSDKSHHYEVFGLRLASNRTIPGLDAERVPGGDVTDIHVTLGSMPRDVERLIALRGAPYHVSPGYRDSDPDHLVVRVVGEGSHYQFVYDGAVEFVVDTANSTIWCRWDAVLTVEEVVLYLLGPVIGFMLRLRGTTCLHASAVLVDGYALAITGASGAGKSTVAASFASAGYPVLTDDVLPLALDNRQVLAQSGYSRLRLYPESFEFLPGLPRNLTPLAPGQDKCFLDLTRPGYRLFRGKAPLGAVYLLDWAADSGQTGAILPVTGNIVIPLLAANTYRNDLLNPDMREDEFYFLSALASAVPVRRLRPEDDISSVPGLCQMILADFKKQSRPLQTSRPRRGTADISQ